MNDDFALSHLWNADKTLLENILTSDGEPIRSVRPVCKEYDDYQKTGHSDPKLGARFREKDDGKPDSVIK